MPVMGKELEPKISPDELAAREVDGYIGRIERQAEAKPPTQITTSQPTVAMSAADAAKKRWRWGRRRLNSKSFCHWTRRS